MTELIRTIRGQETPAPGRWTFAQGQPVVGLAGPWWRTRHAVGRTTGGTLLITAGGSVSFGLTWDGLRWDRPVCHWLIDGRPCDPPTSLTYQSFSVRPAAGIDSWSVDGELIVGSRIYAARSTVTYHGVYRSGPGAVAWLSWQLPFPRSLVSVRPNPAGGRHRLSADLNADAPRHLLERSVPRSR